MKIDTLSNSGKNSGGNSISDTTVLDFSLSHTDNVNLYTYTKSALGYQVCRVEIKPINFDLRM